MQIAKNKIATMAIAIFFMLSMSASMMLIPSTRAQSTDIPTYAYIQVAPNPIGIGQTATIYIWLDKTIYDTALGNDIRFHNYALTIIAPDGTTTTQTFAVVSDPTSNQYTKYTPTQVGTYTLKFSFPGQTYTFNETVMTMFGPGSTSMYIGDYYEPSNTSTTLTVQQQQVPPPTGSSPLPTAFWTRPIYGENNIWYTISSNWLGTGSPVNSATGSGNIGTVGGGLVQRYPGDAVGSLTSHIMWTYPIESGGVVGGNDMPIQGDTYFEGSAYFTRLTNPIIMDGDLFYTMPVSFGGNNAGPTVCQSLTTGQIIWSSTNIPPLSFGYIFDVQDPNQHGVYPPLLFSTGSGGFSLGSLAPAVLEAFDAYTGDWQFNLTGVPGGFEAQGPSGEQLQYVLANDGTPAKPQYYLGEWNMSDVFFIPGGFLGPGITGTVYANLATDYDWNISVPWANTMPTPPPSMFGPGSAFTIIAAFYGNMLLCMNGTYPGAASAFSAASSAPYTYFAVNLNASRGAIGNVLWWNTLNAPPGDITVSFGGADPTVNVFIETYKETMQFIGYSMTTGQKIWGPTASQTSLDYYGRRRHAPCRESSCLRQTLQQFVWRNMLLL